MCMHRGFFHYCDNLYKVRSGLTETRCRHSRIALPCIKWPGRYQDCEDLFPVVLVHVLWKCSAEIKLKMFRMQNVRPMHEVQHIVW